MESIEKKKQKLHFNISSVPIVEKIMFVKNLSLMIRSGFSIGDGLGVLKDQTKSKLLRSTIQDLHKVVIGGSSFASALERHPAVFDDLFVSMVAAGEMSGNLENTLRQLAIQMRKSYDLKKKVKNALIYPVLIFVAMIGMGVFMLIYVVPKIVGLYTDSSFQLPLPTRIIIGVSDGILHNWIIVLAITFALGIGLYMYWKTPQGRFRTHQLLLHVPVAGNIIKQINIARFSRMVHSMIITDIPIVHGFEIIAQTLKNHVYRKEVIHASEQLTKGVSIFSTLQQRPDLFDPVIVQMIKVGEDTGSLEEITEELAEFFEAEVDSTMGNLTIIIEPILMLVMGVGVAFMAVAILMPIYGLVNQV